MQLYNMYSIIDSFIGQPEKTTLQPAQYTQPTNAEKIEMKPLIIHAIAEDIIRPAVFDVELPKTEPITNNIANTNNYISNTDNFVSNISNVHNTTNNNISNIITTNTTNNNISNTTNATTNNITNTTNTYNTIRDDESIKREINVTTNKIGNTKQ
eukprot:PhM_4_TR8396/c3_g1_i3/m.62475